LIIDASPLKSRQILTEIDSKLFWLFVNRLIVKWHLFRSTWSVFWTRK